VLILVCGLGSCELLLCSSLAKHIYDFNGNLQVEYLVMLFITWQDSPVGQGSDQDIQFSC